MHTRITYTATTISIHPKDREQEMSWRDRKINSRRVYSTWTLSDMYVEDDALSRGKIYTILLRLSCLQVSKQRKWGIINRRRGESRFDIESVVVVVSVIQWKMEILRKIFLPIFPIHISEIFILYCLEVIISFILQYRFRSFNCYLSLFIFHRSGTSPLSLVSCCNVHTAARYNSQETWIFVS